MKYTQVTCIGGILNGVKQILINELFFYFLHCCDNNSSFRKKSENLLTSPYIGLIHGNL